MWHFFVVSNLFPVCFQKMPTIGCYHIQTGFQTSQMRFVIINKTAGIFGNRMETQKMPWRICEKLCKIIMQSYKKIKNGIQSIIE